jgi:CheY-like chemotaxis protein
VNTPGVILIAEDDPRDIELVSTSLAELNLANEVVFVRDGAEALEFLRRTGPYADREARNPVVVLLDIKMPRVSGVEVLRQMKGDEQLRFIPAVMLTSSREAPDLAECYKLGVNAYVVKPMRFNDFVTAIKQVGVFWAVINEPLPLDMAGRANGEQV